MIGWLSPTWNASLGQCAGAFLVAGGFCFVTVLVCMGFCGFRSVMRRVECVAVRHVGMVGSGFVLTVLVMPCCFAMMSNSVLNS